MKLNDRNSTPSAWFVRKDWILEWSLILWSKSPINFVSKKDIGNFKSFMKKSLTSEIFIRIDIWSNSQRRTKSVAVLPVTIINSPNNTSQIKPMSLFFIPISTIDCVRNGRVNWRIAPKTNPNVIWIKCFLYWTIYLDKNLMEFELALLFNLMDWNCSVVLKNNAIPFEDPS